MAKVKKEIKQKGPKEVVKRFKLSNDQKELLQNIQSVMGIMNLQYEGMRGKLMLEIAKIRKNLDIKEEDAPLGFQRFVDLDDKTWEMIVIDREIVKPVETTEEAQKADSEAKN